jgi:hypothetical protein
MAMSADSILEYLGEYKHFGAGQFADFLIRCLIRAFFRLLKKDSATV